MPTTFRRSPSAPRAAGLLAIACCLVPAHLAGRPGLSAEPGAGKGGTVGQYLGAGYCARCHKGGPTRPGDDDYVFLTEHRTWSEKDKHALAYQKLTEPRAAEMGRLLRVKDVTADDRCLNCHAANVPKDRRAESFDVKDGVSCDVCHGPSSKWIVPHSQKAWRTTDMTEKVARGMIDVRDPARRARVCASCHVGNAAEGKVVTHDMYAAGHPPLPGFEAATFSRAMPRHWRYQKDKKPEIQKLLKVDPEEHEQTRLTVIGNLVMLRAAADLLAGQAEAAARAKEPDQAWPELAQFDCGACHHDLRSPSWRQQRGYPGVPGRPHMREWPTALAALTIRQADADDLSRRMRKLYRAFDDVPFGKPEDLGPAARRVGEWADATVKQLERRKYNQVEAVALLRELCSLGAREAVDYDSARQVAWTFQVAYDELDPKPEKDRQIAELVGKLAATLGLELPSGTDKEITGQLKVSLGKSADYQPGTVRRLYEQLSALLLGK